MSSKNVQRYLNDLKYATDDFVKIVKTANEVMKKEAAIEKKELGNNINIYPFLGPNIWNIADFNHILESLSSALADHTNDNPASVSDLNKIMAEIAPIVQKLMSFKARLGKVGIYPGINSTAYHVEDVNIMDRSSTVSERFGVALSNGIRAFLRLFDGLQSYFTKQLMNDSRETPGARHVRGFFGLEQRAQFFPKPVTSIFSAREELQIAYENLEKTIQKEIVELGHSCPEY